MNNQHAPAPAQQHLGPLHQPRLSLGLHPRRPGLAGHRRRDHAGRVRLAPAARSNEVDAFQPHRRDLAGGPAAGGDPRHVRRQRARRGRGHLPADEDRRRRGAVDHLRQPLLVLGCSRSVAARTTRPPPRSSRSPTCSPSWPPTTLDGKVQGLNQLNAQYQKEYGPGNYVPNVFIQYWSMRVMAYLATLVFLFALWGAWLALPAQTRTRQVVPAHRALGGDPALPHQHRRLDADRERAPAVDRPGADEDGQRGLTVRVGRPTSGSRSSSSCADLSRSSASPTRGS